MRRKLLIIDGHNFLWKSYGVPFKFYSEKGTPLHVVTTFLSLIRRAVKVVDNSGNCSIAIVFDHEERTSNHRLSGEYKANRKTDYSKDEDSPFHHLSYVIKLLRHLKIKTFMKRGVEADDVIASLATQFLERYKSGKVFIASSDSDFYQLLSGNLSQIILGKNGTYDLISPKEIILRLGINPRQYAYFKSLTGDKADNIKGLPNVGKIRARRIVKKELKMDLRPYAELLVLNRKLIELNRSLRMCSNLEKLALQPGILDFKSRDIFQKIGF